MTDRQEQEEATLAMFENLVTIGEEAGLVEPEENPRRRRREGPRPLRTKACEFCGREVTQRKFMSPFKCASCQGEDIFRKRRGDPPLRIGELLPKPEPPSVYRPPRQLEVVRSPRAVDLERRLSENLSAQQKAARDLEEAERELMDVAQMLDDARDNRDAYRQKRADLENEELVIRTELRAIGVDAARKAV